MMNANAMGVIFPNTYDALIPELVNQRLMASVPFASRYRLVDFLVSSMVNSGIDNIKLLPEKNYHSLMDHLGAGREWDLVRKNGGLSILPPFVENTSVDAHGRIPALAGIIRLIACQKEKYVILTDSNFVANMDFKAILAEHEASGADVTMVYNKEAIPATMSQTDDFAKCLYYTYEVDEDHNVVDIKVNPQEEGVQNFGLNLYVLDRELLMKLIRDAFIAGGTHFVRDVLLKKMGELKLKGYEYDGYVARITGLKSYFDENMKLLADENMDALFGPAPVYTKVRDDNPTMYKKGAVCENSMVADGCTILGTVEGSILSRGVVVGEGAVVNNCILMQDTVIEPGAVVEYIIADKQVTISANKTLKGSDTFPVFVAKGENV